MHARQRTLADTMALTPDGSVAELAPKPGVTDLVPERAGTGLTSRRCVSLRCRRDAETGALQPRLAAARSLLCGHCRDRLDQQLRNLPDLYVEMEQSLNAAVQTNERVSGGRTPGIPLSPRTVEVRAAIRGVLASWAQLVVDERKVSRPIRNVAGMAEFLRRHVDWLGAHPVAAEISSEIGELVAAASQLVHTEASWRVVVAKCSDPECAGDLVAWMRPFDSNLPSEIKCTHNRDHAWPAHRWGSLRRYLNGVARPEKDSA